MLRRASDRCHRDVRHGRFRSGAVPMFFPRSNVHDVADGYVALFSLGRDLALPSRNDENLIAVVHMPPRRCTDSEVNHVATKILRLPVTDDRLPSPAHRPARPSGNRRCRIHRFLLKLVDFKYAHEILLSLTGHNYTSRAESVKRIAK